MEKNQFKNSFSEKSFIVDIDKKKPSKRFAKAEALIRLPADFKQPLLDLQKDISTNKGPLFKTASLIGLTGLKKTSDLIPFCHPIHLSNASIEIFLKKPRLIQIISSVKAYEKTGVEMEALMGASIAALTIYDMLKNHTQAIVIESISLLEKKGGKQDYVKKSK